MKSFFKKLSLVMALAMVVSLVAPAGSAFAAEAGIAKQGTKEVVTEVNVEVGAEVVDFCFLGAPADWKTTFVWTSDNEAVATVDKAGKVTALKDGFANITITAGADGSYKHTVKVTVGTEKTMEVVQVSEITSKLVFTEKVSYKKDDAKLYRIFETATEDVKVSWPIDAWKVADDGMSITFAPFVNYADGDRYVIEVGSYTKEFTTAIGEVTHVFTTYATNYVANTAYVTPEDADEDVKTQLGVQIMSGTVDLTGVYADKFDISYEFYQDAEYENASLDEDDGEITFSDKGAVMVTAVITYEDEDGEDQVLANVMPATITPEEIPAYEVLRVVDWAVQSPSEAWWTFSWNNKSVYAGDEDYQIVLKLTDNRGKTLVTSQVAYDYETYGCGNWNTTSLVTNNAEYTEAGYEVVYRSTNTDNFLVDTTGSVATYKPTTAVIYVELYKDNEDGDSTFVKNIYAFELNVGKARTLTNIISDNSKIELVIDAIDKNDDEYAFIQGGFWFGAYDQGWTAWGDVALVQDGTLDEAEFEVVATSPAEIMDYENSAWGISNYNLDEAWLWVNANELYEITGKTTVKFTVQENVSEKKLTVTVSLKKPDWAAEDEEGVTSLDGELILETSKEWLDVEVGAADKDLGYVDWQDTDLTNISKSATINLYKLSNDQKVGYFYNDEIAGVVTNAKWADATTGISEGQKYIAVVNEKGEYQAVNYDGKAATVQLLTQADDGKLTYAKAGKYTVYVYTVYDVDTDATTGEITDVDYITRKTTFNVTYGQATIACVDRIAIATEYNFGTATAPDEDAIAKIIVESFAWTLNGNTWDIDEASDLVDMANTTYTIKGNNIIIRKVTFKVPYDNGNSLGSKEAYYTKSVEVNMAVEYVD